MQKKILFDGRWRGPHGIGRFATEVFARLSNTDLLPAGPTPLSLSSYVWQSYQLYRHQKTHGVYFTPGFNPVFKSPLPYVMTLHDLIHLHTAHRFAPLYKMYYETLIKPSAKKAAFVLTVSEHAKQAIMEWTGLPSEKIIRVQNGVSKYFNSLGEKHAPGYPYLLHVGNTRPHKNVMRLLEAFSRANIDKSIRLILTGQATPEMKTWIQKNQIEKRVVFSGPLNENQVAQYYRGALAFIFPSLYEGFGLPPLEAMASGVPVITANTTSLPEVVGDAAILINPYETDDLQAGIEKIIDDETLRENLIAKGLERARGFSWDKTTEIIQGVLNAFL